MAAIYLLLLAIFFILTCSACGDSGWRGWFAIIAMTLAALSVFVAILQAVL